MDDQMKNAFLGTGWSSPPTFVKGVNSVLMSRDVQNVNENLRNLFFTNLGERIYNQNYGTQLNRLVFTSQGALLETEIKDSLARVIKLFEPRVILDQIFIDSSDQRSGMILIQVDYTLRKINSRHNFVYPFYISEGTNLDV